MQQIITKYPLALHEYQMLEKFQQYVPQCFNQNNSINLTSIEHDLHLATNEDFFHIAFIEPKEKK